MKVSNTTRKPKPKAKISQSNPQPPQDRLSPAELLRNLIEAIKAEADPSSLIAVMMPSSLIEDDFPQLEQLMSEGLLGEGMIRENLLGLLSPGELFKFHIVDIVCGDSPIPQSVLELIYLILRYQIKFGAERGEAMAEEMKKTLIARMEGGKTLKPSFRRRRPRIIRPPTLKTRKSRADS
jgi:hypothetical protein